MSNEISVENDVVNTAIDEAPAFRDHVKETWRNIKARAIDECAELSDIIFRAEAGLAPRISQAVTALNLDAANKAFDDFISEVRNAISWERQHGRLKQHTPFDELSAWKEELRNHGWGAAAKSIIVDYLLQPGERIAAVDWFTITLTNGRTISRQDIHNNATPLLESEIESDEKVNRLRAEAEEKAAKEARSARMSGTGILGKDGQYRDFSEIHNWK